MVDADAVVRAGSQGVGQTNNRGLTEEGVFALHEMMRHGMLIDIDYMSDASKNKAIQVAKLVDRCAELARDSTVFIRR